jgi:hypothetical protein
MLRPWDVEPALVRDGFGPRGAGIKKECHPPQKARCAFGLERIKIRENALVAFLA